MKQTHTPGPWRVTPIGNETFIDSDGGLICDIKRNARLDCQETYQCDVNARLISSAPDLLSCLKTAEHEIRLTAVIFETQDKPETAKELRSRAAIYAKAIAEAEGTV